VMVGARIRAVVCYSPDHARPARFDNAAVRALIDTWADQSAELSATHAYVQVFENKGAMMGCSSPHPQWPDLGRAISCRSELADEDREQAAWHDAHGTVMLDEVVERD